MRWWLALLLVACRREPPPVRIATFNIEDFPKNPAQVTGAFTELAKTRASVIAVQEIDDPAAFARAERAHLGETWQFVPSSWTSRGEHPHHLGVAYDGARWHLRATAVHAETTLGGRYRPTLEVDLSDGTQTIDVFVVHLKAGGDGHDIRMRQLSALAEVIDRAHDHVVVLGDFNATGDADLEAIRGLARGRLAWATASLACSALWAREDSCPRSRLDHALTWIAPRAAVALGPCADGCATTDRCPLYVSDHCPVVITL